MAKKEFAFFVDVAFNLEKGQYFYMDDYDGAFRVLSVPDHSGVFYAECEHVRSGSIYLVPGYQEIKRKVTVK